MFFWSYGNFKIVLYIPFSNFPIVILSFFPYFISSVSSALSLSLFLSVSPTHIRAYACRHRFSIGEIVDNAKKDKRERKDVANKRVIEKGEKSAKKRERDRALEKGAEEKKNEGREKEIE